MNPNSLAVDGKSAVWVANSNNSISVLGVSPATGFTGGGLASPSALLIDASGNVWIANQGNNSLTQFLGAATPK